MSHEVDETLITEQAGAVSFIPTNADKIRRAIDEHSLPYPTVLLGIGLALWDNVKHEPCRACGNRPLRQWEYCIFCDRWGMDYLCQDRHVDVQMKIFREKLVRLTNGIRTREHSR